MKKMYHDTKIHGPMKYKLITTITNNTTQVTEHEKKINKFNEENMVFFNQETKIITSTEDNTVCFITPILYTEKKEKAPTLPPIKK